MKTNDGKLGFSIGEAARSVSVTSQTLRLWETEGLVNPVRSAGGTRYYRETDMQRLQQIRRLKYVDGLNSAAIRREIGTAGPAQATENEDSKPSPQMLGRRLRSLRLQARKTLKEVAEKTGLSVSFLSTLERGESGASISSLNRIAMAYGFSVRELFGAVNEVPPYLKPEDRPTIEYDNGVRYEELASLRSLMNPTVVHVPPHAGSGGFYSHEGEEFMYMLSGSLFVELKGQGAYRLAPQESLYFSSTTPHYWWTEDEAAKLVYINTPRTF